MGGKTTPLTDDQRASILDMFHEGATRRDIATAHGVSTGVVSKIVQAAGHSFPGRTGTRAATLARQLDLAAWHEQKAAELREQEAAALDRAAAAMAAAGDDPRRRVAAGVGPTDEWERLHDAAEQHAQAAERMRYAANLRDMPDNLWPHTFRMAALAEARGQLGKDELEAITTEYRRREPNLHPLIRAQIEYELWQVRGHANGMPSL